MKETELKFSLLNDAVLTSPAKEVSEVTGEHRRLFSRMARLMYDVSGVGLAAPQVGINLALIVVDVGDGLYKLANPRIVKAQGEQPMEEGCLSVPETGVKVRRAEKVTLEALDENGKKVVIEAEGILARAFQHEVDHLKGRLIIDYLPEAQRKKIAARLLKKT